MYHGITRATNEPTDCKCQPFPGILSTFCTPEPMQFRREPPARDRNNIRSRSGYPSRNVHHHCDHFKHVIFFPKSNERNTELVLDLHHHWSYILDLFPPDGSTKKNVTYKDRYCNYSLFRDLLFVSLTNLIFYHLISGRGSHSHPVKFSRSSSRTQDTQSHYFNFTVGT